MNSPKISIVIPSYNKVKYIEETLKSIINQSYKNFEVIIQDGGSTDGTLEIIKKYSKKYPKYVSYVSKKDGGQLDAINAGIKKAKGEIIAFINADDVYTPDTFKSVIGHYTEYPNAEWFVGKSIVIDEDGNQIAKLAMVYKDKLLSMNSYLGLLVTNYIMQPSVFLNKSIFKKYGLFTGSKFAVMEYDMWLKIGKQNMPIIINKALSKFRIEKMSKTSTNFTQLLKDDNQIVKRYTKNTVILFLHMLHNYFRVIMFKII